jgi:hypothetical protein
MTAHTIEEALDAFELIAGVGSEANRQACAMSLLAWVNGDEWGDAMSCAHPLIRSLVIRANDAPDTTAKDRAELVRLGEHGVIETWWVPTEVVVAALAVEDGLDPFGPLDTAKRVLTLVADWKASTDKVRPDLRGADLGGAYLGGAYLRGADLRGADLRGAYLRGAYLRGAYLGDANLMDANLMDANLMDANLRYANLRGADLRGADLRGAYLGGADLGGAYLGGAYLGGAYLGDAYLGDANLRGANLGGARGDQYTVLPDGYRVTADGIIVRRAA